MTKGNGKLVKCTPTHEASAPPLSAANATYIATPELSRWGKVQRISSINNRWKIDRGRVRIV